MGKLFLVVTWILFEHKITKQVVVEEREIELEFLVVVEALLLWFVDTFLHFELKKWKVCIDNLLGCGCEILMEFEEMKRTEKMKVSFWGMVKNQI